jgi:hypothetical protein
MRICGRTLLAPSITAMVTAIAAPNEAVGQISGARPASVSLTVIVPPSRAAATPVVGAETVTVMHRAPSPESRSSEPPRLVAAVGDEVVECDAYRDSAPARRREHPFSVEHADDAIMAKRADERRGILAARAPR